MIPVRKVTLPSQGSNRGVALSVGTPAQSFAALADEYVASIAIFCYRGITANLVARIIRSSSMSAISVLLTSLLSNVKYKNGGSSTLELPQHG